MFTNSDSLAEQMRIIANHGMKVRYYHEVIGVNSRLDNLQAAVLRIKLRRLDDYKAARNAVAALYDQAFAEVDQLATPQRNPNSTHAFHQYTLKCHGIDRDALREHLAEQEIPSMIYYPVPLHQQKAFEVAGLKQKPLPITETLSKQVISFPIHTEMDDDQLERISKTVTDYVNLQ